MNNSSDQKFGGLWTIEKLDILEHYMNSFTTALKNQPFKLVYIDLFAGTGWIDLKSKWTDPSDQDLPGFLAGSATRALKVDNKPFDRLIFVEKDEENCKKLSHLRQQHPDRDIQIENADANKFIRKIDCNWKSWRGVLFVDPSALQVDWSTIETIASFEALDTWILFPIGSLARIMPLKRRPGEVEPSWAKRLTRVFGNDEWSKVYWEKYDLFGDKQYGRHAGVEGIRELYAKQLQRVFGDRYLSKHRKLTNSKDSHIYDFIFCAGNPKGTKVAKKIAKHIIDHL